MVVANQWSEPSQIDQMWIQNSDAYLDKGEDRGYDLRQGLISFSYYESLFSPHVTASLSYLDTGYSQESGSGGDIQERPGTVFTNLPIRGNESIRAKISHGSGSFDFDDYSFKVTNITRASAGALKEVVSFNLTSRYALIDKNKRVQKRYYNNIGDNVFQILNTELGIPTTQISVEKTQSTLSFLGNSLHPFDLVLSLAPKSTPVDGASGYFFYESNQIFNFRSADSLVNAGAVATYTADSQVSVSDADHPINDPNFRVLNYAVKKNEDILSKLESGSFSSRLNRFNPASQKWEYKVFTLGDDMVPNTMGTESYDGELLNTSHSDLLGSKDANSRTYSTEFSVIDWVGNQEQDSGFGAVGVTTAVNNSSFNHKASALMRYNTLFTQIIDMVVPLNFTLKVGRNINCRFMKLTGGDQSEGIEDQKLSGKYLIINLCHNFTRESTNASTTHLTIVRDTYGYDFNT